MQRSLASKLSWLFGLLILAMGVVVLSSFAYLSAKQVDRRLKVDSKAVQTLLEQLLRDKKLQLTTLGQFMANSPRVRYLALGDSETSQQALPALRQDSHVDAVAISDRDGHILGQLGFSLGTSDSLSQGVRTALTQHAWSGVVSSTDSSSRSIYLAVTIPLVNGGYCVGSVTVAYEIGVTMARTLARATGTQIGIQMNAHMLASSMSQLAKLPALGISPRAVTVRDIEYMAFSPRLPQDLTVPGLEFAVLRRTDEVTGPYQGTTKSFVAILFLVLSAGVYLGQRFTRNITQSLDGIVLAARVLQTGAWPERLDPGRDDEIGFLRSVFNDMTDSLKSSQEKLLSLIHKDPLTELDNHRSLQDKLERQAQLCRALGETMSLILFDIDNFREFNTQYGHERGDQVLIEFASLLRRFAPQGAIIARYGGEEFAVLIPRSEKLQAEILANRLREQAQEANFTVSAGCAEFRPDTGDPEGLTLAAELALSRAKNTGRNRVAVFDSETSAANPAELRRFAQEGSFATIEALAAAVDAKDPYTEGHSRRVAEYARDLARFIGQKPEFVDLVFRSGTLHDVGKIGVPDAILKKPGRLDPEEQAIMETHPVLGELIALKAPQLQPLLPGVRHHHERFDGKGYPDQLAGEAIPLVARILAVADTYDAMTSDRPYRKGLAVEIALGEIAKGAGSQFDPGLAEAFVRMRKSRPDTTEGGVLGLAA